MTHLADPEAPSAGGVEEVDVAIFGAGPAGLATALAFSKACPALKVHVFERASKLRPSGGSIGLSTKNVFTAFEALGDNVAQAVKEAGITRRNFITADKDGHNRVEQQIPSSIIAWYELQQALLRCLPREVMVSLGSELSEIVEEEGGVVLATTKQGRQIRGKLIVGADGNASACRKFVQGGTKPEYVGAAVWRFFMPGDNPFVEVSDTLVLTGDCKTMVMQAVKREGKVLTYCAGISGFDEQRLDEMNQTRYVQAAEEDTQGLHAKLGRFSEALEGFNPEMLQYVREHAVPESVLEHPMFTLDPCNAWVRGRVVLVGDAAHVMPPNLSQGTPQAIEDAVQLAASVLSHQGISTAALHEYETLRKERVTPIWQMSTDQAMNYYKEKSAGDNPMKISVAKGTNVGDILQSIAAYVAPCLDPPCGADTKTY